MDKPQAVVAPASSGNGTFRPYEGHRDEVVVVHDMNVEASPIWLLKNSLPDCVYQNDENSLRGSMTEIKTYEEVYTGKTVSCLLSVSSLPCCS